MKSGIGHESGIRYESCICSETLVSFIAYKILQTAREMVFRGEAGGMRTGSGVVDQWTPFQH